MGGELEITVRFPDRNVRIKNFRDLGGMLSRRARNFLSPPKAPANTLSYDPSTFNYALLHFNEPTGLMHCHPAIL